MDIETSYNFRRINDRLTTSGLVKSAGLKVLAAQGYAAVINLLPETNEYATPGEREIVEAQGIEYIYIPVDFKQPTRFDFEKFSAALDQVGEKKVHVHCAANYRVSTFYSLYQVRAGRWSIDQANEFIRGIWRPEEHPGWSDFISEIVSENH